MTSIDYLTEQVFRAYNDYHNDHMKFTSEVTESVKVAREMQVAETLEAELAGMKKFKEIIGL
jgi:hypothetical protein